MLDRRQQHPIMCLTQDGLPFSHVVQAERLCSAGARWIQLRMKNAGLDPWRYTTTKQRLGSVLGAAGARALVAQLDGLPAWIIGGIESRDLPAVRATGATGAAVSSALFRGGRIEESYRALAAAWNSGVSE